MSADVSHVLLPDTDVRTESESISGRHCNDEQSSQAPDDSIRSQWSTKRLRGDPELGEGQNALSTGFSDSARKPNDDGDHVAKRRKGD